jgi:hypothetical protein
MNKKIKLFFTAGKVPTAKEREQAAALDMTCFRNASRVGVTLEAADEVAGAVPERYRKVPGCLVQAVGLTADARAAQAKAEAEAKAQAEADVIKAKQHRR